MDCDAQEWMSQHLLPDKVPPTGLLPATTYVVIPPQLALEQKGISPAQAITLEAAFFVTKEMINSLFVYTNALNVAGFETNHIGIDIDGKHKLVRNGWELITFGARYVTGYGKTRD